MGMWDRLRIFAYMALIAAFIFALVAVIALAFYELWKVIESWHEKRRKGQIERHIQAVHAMEARRERWLAMKNGRDDLE